MNYAFHHFASKIGAKEVAQQVMGCWATHTSCLLVKDKDFILFTASRKNPSRATVSFEVFID